MSHTDCSFSKAAVLKFAAAPRLETLVVPDQDKAADQDKENPIASWLSFGDWGVSEAEP